MITPLTGEQIATAWTLNLPAVVFVVLLGGGYLWTARQVDGWPRGRTAAFLSGLAIVVLLTCSFLGVYEDVLFWVRALQVLVLLMIVPLLLALGAPLTLALAVAPGAARLRRWGRSPFARAATFPLVITALLIVPPFLIYLTPLYEATQRNPAIDNAVRFVLVCCGFLYFWTRLRVDPTPREDHHLVSFCISFADVLVDAALGLILWLGPLRAAGYYEALARTWGPDLRTDQIIGAGILWIGGDLAGIPFVAVLFNRWMREDDRQAKRIDRELDAKAATEPTGTLWWETDPILAERFKPEQER
ncbi:cytochrome c oxidase assembly protein [Saccharomonospora sp. NPDC046836]|uniref:cytochrome c oxidase assembly protein n=1 Tax=Saccharomonospora sp. NPDC046836 TaxID=3156921 RepID=UPI003403C8B1